MSVLRQLNVLAQMRVDVPHLRSIESGVAADFDATIGRATAGGRPLVVRGFGFNGSGVGGAASALAVSTADGIVYNLNATESGSFLWVPADRVQEILDPVTNSRVTGSWTPGATNYVGIDLVRSSDPLTTDLVQFLDPGTLLETPKQVPIGRTLDYRLVISTLPFSSQTSLVPLAIVIVNSTGTVTSNVDARQMLYRLGSGGDAPNSLSYYAWPGGRSESAYTGGDKVILSQKDWQDAVMTRLWEQGGGEHWYSATADRGVTLAWLGSAFSNGEHFSWSAPTLSWQGLRFLFDNSTGWYNDVATGTASLTADGQCIYVDLDRTQNRTGGTALVPVVAPLTTLGPGSVPGARQILAYRSSSTEVYAWGWRLPVGTSFLPATTGALGVVRLNATPGNALTPYVVAIQANGIISVAATAGASNCATFTAFGTGAGVIGNAAPSGSGTGVIGNAKASGGIGVHGNGFSGVDSYGVVGTGYGTCSGVKGEGAGNWSTTGVYGTGGSSGGYGTGGKGVSGLGAEAGQGVFGRGGGTGPNGVWANQHYGAGVHGVGGGYSGLGTGIGVYGTGDIATGTLGVRTSGFNNTGVLGVGTEVFGGDAGFGVAGVSAPRSGAAGGFFQGSDSGFPLFLDTCGVKAYGKNNGTGIYGENDADGIGVHGVSVGYGTAVYGESNNIAVHGAAQGGEGVLGTSFDGYGVHGTSTNTCGVLGEAYAAGQAGTQGSNGHISGIGVTAYGGGSGGRFEGTHTNSYGILAYGTGSREGVFGRGVNGIVGESTGAGFAVAAATSGEMGYLAARSRYYHIPMIKASAYSASGTFTQGSDGSTLLPCLVDPGTDADLYITFPIHLPAGATTVNIRLLLKGRTPSSLTPASLGGGILYMNGGGAISSVSSSSSSYIGTAVETKLLTISTTIRDGSDGGAQYLYIHISNNARAPLEIWGVSIGYTQTSIVPSV